MSRMGPFTVAAGSDTTVRTHTNKSLGDSTYKNASSILAVNGVSIVKEFETDMDARSLGVGSLKDESNRV